MEQSNTKNQINLNEFLNTNINKAIKLYDNQIDYKGNSKEWKDLEEEINTLCLEVGRHIMYQSLDLPF